MQTPNNAVEKLSSWPHPAVNQMEYQGSSRHPVWGVRHGPLHIDTSPRFLAVDLERQLLPGTVEHALNHLLDQEIGLSGFGARYGNDATGADVSTTMIYPHVPNRGGRGVTSAPDRI